MDDVTNRKSAVKAAQEEIEKWQAKVDEARVQLHLGAREAEEKIRPHIDELELGLDQAKEQLQDLEQAADDAWDDIRHGLNLSFKNVKEAFGKAERHFQKPEGK